MATRLPPQILVRVVRAVVQTVLSVTWGLGRILRVGRGPRYPIPDGNYDGDLLLFSNRLREWTVLDTFDEMARRFDEPQSVDAIRR